MSTVIDIFETLESDNSRIFKEDVLEKNKNNDLLRRAFVASLDPYVNYYVSKFKMPNPQQTKIVDDDRQIRAFLDVMLVDLSTRKITGNSAKDAVTSAFSLMDSRQQKWCLRILLKNLRCGVQETTVNKIWPDSISKFSVQLAETLKSHFEKGNGIVLDDSIKYPVRVEPKLDGLRCVAVKKSGSVTMFTRNGTILETLPMIKSAIENAPWDDFVLDGEAMGSDWNESASIIMSRKNNKDDSRIVYNVFDAMHFDDWRCQENAVELMDRVDLVEDLVKRVKNPCVVQVLGQKIFDQKSLMAFYSKSMEDGYEGIMIKNLHSKYHFKRSSSVMKLKPCVTYEGVIVGNYEGRRGSKREGLWGGFEVMMPNGVITRVGGGFTDKLKAEIGIDPESWLGRIVELEGQPDPMTHNGLTADGRVRFPVFIRERDISDVDSSLRVIYDSFKQKKQ